MNKYCNKFELRETCVEDTLHGIHYINEKDLKEDNGCGLVCDQTNQGVCNILNHFKNLQRPIIRINKDVDEFGDDKPNYLRKLK